MGVKLRTSVRPYQQICAWCGVYNSQLGSKVQKLKRCGKCQLVYYCNAACQEKHWKGGHEQECGVGVEDWYGKAERAPKPKGDKDKQQQETSSTVEDLQKGFDQFCQRKSGLCSAPGCSKKGAKACARCHKARYCSAPCQKADWGAHKKACKSHPK